LAYEKFLRVLNFSWHKLRRTASAGKKHYTKGRFAGTKPGVVDQLDGWSVEIGKSPGSPVNHSTDQPINLIPQFARA
jgi:hypothetical protein